MSQSARIVVDRVIADGRTWLDPIELYRLLTAYAIPATPVALARNADEAATAAAPFLADGGAVVVKILSPDIVHKSDVGGVHLNLTRAEAVRVAAAGILARARAARPDARITGVTVQSHDPAPQGARADRRRCRRSDVRPDSRRLATAAPRSRSSTTRRWRCRRSISSWRAI